MLLDIYLGRRSALDNDPPGQPGFVEYKFPEEECLKLHVIGPCGDCKFWAQNFELPPGLPPEAVKDLEGTHRQCENLECSVMVSPITFGCIHFEQKDRRVRQYDEAEKALPDEIEGDRRRGTYNYDEKEA